jgi:hypothetical protein
MSSIPPAILGVLWKLFLFIFLLYWPWSRCKTPVRRLRFYWVHKAENTVQRFWSRIEGVVVCFDLSDCLLKYLHKDMLFFHSIWSACRTWEVSQAVSAEIIWKQKLNYSSLEQEIRVRTSNKQTESMRMERFKRYVLKNKGFENYHT